MHNNTTEIPPVPRCFSHLVVATTDVDIQPVVSQSSSPSSSPKSAISYLNMPSLQLRRASSEDAILVPKLQEYRGIKSDSDSSSSVTVTACQQGQEDQEHDEGFVLEQPSSSLRLRLVSRDFDDDCNRLQIQGDGSSKYPDLQTKPEVLEELAKESIPSFNLKTKQAESNDPKSPYVKLNSSLMRLREEMKDLRFIDINLFYQLVSLHEAIQDFKLNMTDRFSETGSEYSLGTASYMGSMSSLNEESDWTEDGMQSEDIDGDAGNDDHRQSASSLLQQITDLALRADEDF